MDGIPHWKIKEWIKQEVIVLNQTKKVIEKQDILKFIVHPVNIYFGV